MSAAALVFESGGRLFWLENGTLWTWARVSWRWWPVRTGDGARVGGRVFSRDEVLSVIASAGSPTRPRVVADALMPCLKCGQLTPPERAIYFGARGPFCHRAHVEAWVMSQPVIDARSTRA